MRFEILTLAVVLFVVSFVAAESRAVDTGKESFATIQETVKRGAAAAANKFDFIRLDLKKGNAVKAGDVTIGGIARHSTGGKVTYYRAAVKVPRGRISLEQGVYRLKSGSYKIVHSGNHNRRPLVMGR